MGRSFPSPGSLGFDEPDDGSALSIYNLRSLHCFSDMDMSSSLPPPKSRQHYGRSGSRTKKLFVAWLISLVVLGISVGLTTHRKPSTLSENLNTGETEGTSFPGEDVDGGSAKEGNIGNLRQPARPPAEPTKELIGSSAPAAADGIHYSPAPTETPASTIASKHNSYSKTHNVHLVFSNLDPERRDRIVIVTAGSSTNGGKAIDNGLEIVASVRACGSQGCSRKKGKGTVTFESGVIPPGRWQAFLLKRNGTKIKAASEVFTISNDGFEVGIAVSPRQRKYDANEERGGD